MPSLFLRGRASVAVCVIIAAAAFLLLVAEVRLVDPVRVGIAALAGRAGP